MANPELPELGPDAENLTPDEQAEMQHAIEQCVVGSLQERQQCQAEVLANNAEILKQFKFLSGRVQQIFLDAGVENIQSEADLQHLMFDRTEDFLEISEAIRDLQNEEQFKNLVEKFEASNGGASWEGIFAVGDILSEEFGGVGESLVESANWNRVWGALTLGLVAGSLGGTVYSNQKGPWNRMKEGAKIGGIFLAGAFLAEPVAKIGTGVVRTTWGISREIIHPVDFAKKMAGIAPEDEASMQNLNEKWGLAPDEIQDIYAKILHQNGDISKLPEKLDHSEISEADAERAAEFAFKNAKIMSSAEILDENFFAKNNVPPEKQMQMMIDANVRTKFLMFFVRTENAVLRNAFSQKYQQLAADQNASQIDRGDLSVANDPNYPIRSFVQIYADQIAEKGSDYQQGILRDMQDGLTGNMAKIWILSAVLGLLAQAITGGGDQLNKSPKAAAEAIDKRRIKPSDRKLARSQKSKLDEVWGQNTVDSKGKLGDILKILQQPGANALGRKVPPVLTSTQADQIESLDAQLFLQELKKQSNTPFNGSVGDIRARIFAAANGLNSALNLQTAPELSAIDQNYQLARDISGAKRNQKVFGQATFTAGENKVYSITNVKTVGFLSVPANIWKKIPPGISDSRLFVGTMNGAETLFQTFNENGQIFLRIHNNNNFVTRVAGASFGEMPENLKREVSQQYQKGAIPITKITTQN